MNPFNFFKLIYWRYFASPINYAKHLGVKVGDYTTISIRDWSSEPYLVTIGIMSRLHVVYPYILMAEVMLLGR